MTTNVNTQTGIAGDADTNPPIDPEGDDDREVLIHIATLHKGCEGVMVGDQIDEDVNCEIQYQIFTLDGLDTLTRGDLDRMIMETIGDAASDHGETVLDIQYLTLEYAYDEDEDDEEAEDLYHKSDEELRAILASGPGTVVVEWNWA